MFWCLLVNGTEIVIAIVVQKLCGIYVLKKEKEKSKL